MPIAHAMWIHGHSIRIEYPNLMDDDTRRAGGFMRLVGLAGKHNWFHVAIPTPVYVEDHRLTIDSLMLRFRTSGATLTKVHIYDGEDSIMSHNELSLNPNDWTFERFDVFSKPKVKWGVGLSFKVDFGSGTNRKIEVSAAGGDFLTDMT
jgi:hypothetical protein